MKVTQKDIATKLGVSTSLVSRVLSGQAHKIGVHQSKIDEIMRVAKELNYVPSPAALALRGKKSNTIGVISYDFRTPFFSELIAEIQELTHDKDYSLLLVGFLNRHPTFSDLLPLYKHFVDGIIILGSFGDLSWTDAFGETPIARIGHGEHKNLTLSVSIDEYDASHKIFGYISGNLKKTRVTYAMRDLPAHVLRRDVILEVAKNYGCTVDVKLSNIEPKDFPCGNEIAKKLLSDGKPLPQWFQSRPSAAGDGYDGGEAARLGADFLEFKPAVGQFDRVEQGVVALVGLKEKEFHQGAFGKARGCAADGGGHALGLGAEHGERQQESKANLFHWFGI